MPARAGSSRPILYNTAVLGLHRQRVQTAMPVRSKSLQPRPWKQQLSNRAIVPRKTRQGSK